MDFERLQPEQLPAASKRKNVSSSKLPESSGHLLKEALRRIKELVLELLWLIVMVLGQAFVWSINAWLNYWAPPYQEHVQLKGLSKVGGHLATDGVSPPGHGVNITLYAAKYGPHPKETLDTMICEDRSLAAKRPGVVYVHGGGWIAANSACLLHSVAPIARAGYDLYSLDYPLAPQVRFPEPIVSLIRALAWVLEHEHHDSVLLLGDSAGGNLVSMAASVVMNRSLLVAFSKEVGIPFHEMKLPKIVAVSSIYGIMDQHAWLQDLNSISWLENKITQFCISFAFRLYRCPNNRFDNNVTIMDILHHVEELPPMQLLCGSKDVLVWSNRVFHQELKQRKFLVEYQEFEARHCFFGFPPQWLPEDVWQNSSKKALESIVSFFEKHTTLHYDSHGHPDLKVVTKVTKVTRHVPSSSFVTV